MTRSFAKIIVYLVVLLIGLPTISFSQPIASISNDGIAYTIAGEGRLLVLIHGSNLDRRMWSTQVDRFSRDFKVLTYDLRGLGASETPSAPYSDAFDLAQLLKEVDESNATLIGLSAGAQVALDFAIQRPDQVEKLVLVSPSLNGFTPDKKPSYFSDLIDALQQQDYDRANEVLLGPPIMSVPSGSEDLVRKMVSSSKQWELPYELVQQNPQPVILNLNKIDIPTLILVGEKDISAVKELGSFLMNGLPNADLIIIPDGRHLLNLSSPNEFNAELARFVGPGHR